MGAGAVAFWDGVLANEDTVLMAGLLNNITTSGTLTNDDGNVVGYTGRDYATTPWEIVAFDDIRLPGICDVKGLTKCNVKNKKAPGSKGNKPTFLGYAPAEFDVICRFWTPSQWDIVLDELDRLWNVPMGNPQTISTGATKLVQIGQNAAGSAITKTQKITKKRIDPAQFTHSIDHPKLQALKISYCIINQVGMPHEGKTPGEMVIEIKCTEIRDPGKMDVTATPKPAPVKRHHNFDGTPPKNSSQLPPPSQDAANLGLKGPPVPGAGGTS